MQHNDVFLVIYNVNKYKKFQVQSFIITNETSAIISQINHREHFYRRQAFTSFEAAKAYLLCKISNENLEAFGLNSADDIILNAHYYLPSLN